MNHNDLLDIATFLPRILQAPSAWLGHLPFAGWLIREVKPKIFVELGSHYGHSYFSFCQAVSEAALTTKCYAVDSWQGDEHAGEYNEDVFTAANLHNSEHYKNFSTLLRMSFDDAVSYFADDSIELLHIDGMHTYEAVKHDFDTWLPKLAPGAVVVFHDTNVRERGFGVWRLWEELQTRYPNNLEFRHSYGLGVLQVNNALSDKKLIWLETNSPYKNQLIRYFSALGARQLERYDLNLSKVQISGLNKVIAERDEQITCLTQATTRYDEQVSSLNKFIAERDEQITCLTQATTRYDEQVSSLNKVIAERDEQITCLTQATTRYDEQVSSLNKVIAERDEQIIDLNQVVAERDSTVNALLSSTSWKLTKPWRWCGSHVQRVKLLFRVVDLANTYTGGHKRTLIKVVEVYKREGLSGIRSRARFLLERKALQNSTHTISSHESNQSSASHHSKEVFHHHQSVDIIVCVHNALDDVKRCLEAVMCNTYPPYNLIIVDDGSHQDTKQYLEKFVVGQPATMIRNDSATGYTKAANSGMRASKGDFVVLLNSDTVVPPRWLDRMIQCANSSEKIGMVGPLSNTASWQSIPQIFNDTGDWADNPLPAGWTVDKYANEVARVSPRIYPRVGFLNGFCLLIKKALIADIGMFDELTFARGYGEENDYALRATANGWQLAVADDCYVYHAQSKSYSHEKRAMLAKLAGEELANKHGSGRISRNLSLTQPHLALHYMRQVCNHIEKISSYRADAQQCFEGKRVLFLLPARSAGGGGNIVLLEAACMRALGVDVWIANLEINCTLFEQSYQNLQVPVLYLQTPADLLNVAKSFDAVVATLFLTVYWMEHLQNLDNCPVLGYYVQDFEPDFFEKGSSNYQSALASYTAINNLRIFTKTNWNKQALIEKLGVSATAVGPCLDVDRFYPSPYVRASDGVIKILAMVRPSTPRRSPMVTMRILKNLSEKFGSRIRITIFGVSSNDAEFLTYPKDFPFENLGEINSEGVAAALSDADIFLDCSVFQAMGLTAMEAMASGVAVVGPTNGGLKEIIVDGYNGVLIDTQSEDAIFSAAANLITDDELRMRIKNNALEVVIHSPIASSFKILDCLFHEKHEVFSDMSLQREVACDVR